MERVNQLHIDFESNKIDRKSTLCGIIFMGKSSIC